MSKILEKREKLREKLLAAAENMIAAGGLAALKSRELAQRIGIANGAIYNLVDDLDDLIVRVRARTLARLDAALTAAESETALPATGRLARIAVAYCDFAVENTELWRAMFEHRMPVDKVIPEQWTIEHMGLFQHIHRPLVELFPKRSAAERDLLARNLFSAVHGMVVLGLEQKLIAMPLDVLRREIARIVRATVSGLVLEEKARATST